jgi:BirA family transcriptional regulator, biotin operon repressor / biotin---[acetyl-CoA-carboxylase] ligase
MPAKKNTRMLLELNSVDSTNKHAMGWIKGVALPKGHEEPQHGMAVLAYQQTQGRGQRGKSWLSPAGESMSLSIVLKTDFLRPSQGFQLLCAIAVAAIEVLKTYTGDETKIKWPNDLYWRNRKLGGILIENVVKGSHYSWATSGIGINVKQQQFPDFLSNPVSIKQITGKDQDIKLLALHVQDAVLNAVDLLKKNPDVFFNRYNQHLFKKQESVTLKKDNIFFETNINGVNEQGELMTGADGQTIYKFGEVEWML